MLFPSPEVRAKPPSIVSLQAVTGQDLSIKGTMLPI
jgi:hypothetical protein